MKGLPFFSFKTIISLKLIPLEIPVPSAFEKLLLLESAKQFEEFLIFAFFYFFFVKCLSKIPFFVLTF